MGIYYMDELYHHGIKGQKWGVRRYQNDDGSLTSAGQKRYYRDEYKAKKKEINKRRNEINAKYDKKNTDTVFGLDSGGVGNRIKGHLKNEYERSKALNKLDQEKLDAKREYRKKLGKKKTDTMLMKLGQKNIDEISKQSMSEFTKNYIENSIRQAYNDINNRRPAWEDR